MQETILIIYLVVAIALVGIILLQQGKGAEMGASFGAGGANTVFGAAGSGNALTKTTTILAILFFGIALSISYLNSTPAKVVDTVFDEVPAVEKTDIESALPEDADANGIEGELPPADASSTDNAEMTDKAASEAPEKIDATKAEPMTDTDTMTDKAEEPVKTEKPKKEGDNQ